MPSSTFYKILCSYLLECLFLYFNSVWGVCAIFGPIFELWAIWRQFGDFFVGLVFVLPSLLFVSVWLLFFFVVLSLWLLFVLLLFVLLLLVLLLLVLLLFAVCCCCCCCSYLFFSLLFLFSFCFFICFFCFHVNEADEEIEREEGKKWEQPENKKKKMKQRNKTEKPKKGEHKQIIKQIIGTKQFDGRLKQKQTNIFIPFFFYFLSFVLLSFLSFSCFASKWKKQYCLLFRCFVVLLLLFGQWAKKEPQKIKITTKPLVL